MASTLPINFPSPGAPVNANYDFTDLITNQSYIILYGLTDLASATTLVRQRIETHLAQYRYQYNGAGAGSALGEVNFDYQFKVPQRVKGTAYVRVVFFAQATATQTAGTYLKVRLLHYDGSTETEIGASQTTQEHVETNDSYTSAQWATIAWTVDQYFKVDEKLRIEVQTWSNYTTGSVSGFYADPASTDYGVIIRAGSGGTVLTSAGPTDFLAYIPVDAEV